MACIITSFQIAFHYVDIPQFVIHPSADGHSNCFYTLAIKNNAACDYFAMYTNIQSLCRAPETNICRLYLNTSNLKAAMNIFV